VTASRGYRTREDQSRAASTTDTSDTTSPMSQPAELLEDMIAAIATPMPTIPPVAITRTNVRSSTPRPLRAGSMVDVAGAPPPPARRWARLALRLAAADGSGSYDLDSGSDDARGSATDSREGSLDAASSSGSAAVPPASDTSESSLRGAISGSGSFSAMLLLYITGLTRSETLHDANHNTL
jgi:hypothetical protein